MDTFASSWCIHHVDKRAPQIANQNKSQNVKIYCATVGVSNVTVPCGQYSDYDGTVDVCSGDHDRGVASDIGWTTTYSNPGKGKANGKPNPWKTKEPFQVVLFDGINWCDQMGLIVIGSSWNPWDWTIYLMGLNLCRIHLCSDDWKAEEPSSLNEPLVGLLLW